MSNATKEMAMARASHEAAYGRAVKEAGLDHGLEDAELDLRQQKSEPEQTDRGKKEEAKNPALKAEPEMQKGQENQAAQADQTTQTAWEENIILEVKDLNTYFKVGRKTVKAVNGVSFRVRRGKTLGIVGESGCGKSVTAHSIIKLLPKYASVETKGILFRPEEGREIDLTHLADDGKEMRAIRGKEIAMIFQDPMSCLNPVYTVGDQVVENILEHAPKLPYETAKQTTVDMFQKLGIPDAPLRFDEYPHEFSGGMKQRVMIALGMINNPKLLIADEPTTALDVTIQAQILELMQQIQKEYGTTIIIITHNMGIVADMADDIAVMYMGKVVETGTREQIFHHPTHPYTAALLKSVPVLGSKKKRLEPIRGTTPDPSEMPEGCAFAPRCDYAGQQCAKTYPPVTDIGGGHQVACWRCVKE